MTPAPGAGSTDTGLTAVEQAVRRRRTVRRYDPDRPVTEAELARVLRAGLDTPSAGHTQAVELLVLTAAADRERYWEVTAPPDRPPDAWLRGMRGAPVLVLVWTSETAYRDRYAEADKAWPWDSSAWSAPYWWVDAGMVVHGLLLTATALGLASAFVGVPRRAQPAVAREFAVPPGHSSVGLVTLGHPPAGHRPPMPRRAARRWSDRTHRGRWGRPG